MKKYLFMLIAVVCTTAASAQQEMLQIKMGDKVVTYPVAEIDEISFIIPQNQLVSGNHSGKIDVTVGMMTYTTNTVTYVITANDDGTIDVVVPEYTLNNTPMGDMAVGSYTVKNIAYNESKSAFYRDYTDDNIIFHFKTSSIDKDYVVKGDIEVKKTDNVLTINNNFRPGSMPMSVNTTFGKE